MPGAARGRRGALEGGRGRVFGERAFTDAGRGRRGDAGCFREGAASAGTLGAPGRKPDPVSHHPVTGNPDAPVSYQGAPKTTNRAAPRRRGFSLPRADSAFTC